jgi:hypothetical protein
MTDPADAAVERAESLREDGVPAVARPDLYRRAKADAEADTIDHATAEAAMTEAGWEYGRHVYVDPDALESRTAEMAETLRESGRLLVTHRQVRDRLAGEEAGADVAGWQRGPFVEHVVAAFESAGWIADTVEGASSRVYVYPLLDAIRDEHPEGRFWRSPEELFGYYLSKSATAAAEGTGDG